MVKAIQEFLRLESASGLLLLGAAVLALVAANSPLAHWYEALLGTPVAIQVGALVIAKPLLLWINDGLMAIFFFLIGLELKREFLDGELSNPAQLVLPAAAALGGMVVPALIYVAFNWHDAMALKGWAIPAATDIAFALGVLAVLGSRVPATLKIFLMTLAILDDLGAIVVIALFYTDQISLLSLGIGGMAVVGLALMNRFGVKSLAPYLLVGLVLWVSVLKSGVHATLAGVVLAFFIPFQGAAAGESPLRRLEDDLHPAVAFAILPIFAFANAGVSLEGVTLATLTNPVPLGIALGLFVGKQIGVFGFTWLAITVGWARRPEGVSWSQLYGVSVLCGIGFTMSLFIGSLAFEQGNTAHAVDDRLGILMGSLISAVVGYAVLRWVAPETRHTDQKTVALEK